MLTILLLLAPGHTAERSFLPTSGPERAVVVDGHLGSIPVRFTHAVVARVDDPDALRALPDVSDVRVLRGDGHVVRIALDPAVDEAAWSTELRERADVTWAHPDFAMPRASLMLPNDPAFPDQWHLLNTGQRNAVEGFDINIEPAWALTTGAGQIVSVLDSGVDLDHPDLDVIAGPDVIGQDDDPSPDFSHSGAPHGTASAGVIGGKGNNGIGIAGVAYDAQIYAVRLIGDGSVDLSSTYDGLVAAVDAGASVLSNSWGFSADGCPDLPPIGILNDAVDYAEENGRGGLGTAMVVSAGNGNCDMSTDGFQAHPAIISVGAMTNQGVRANYSNWGAYLDIMAPSGNIVTTDISGPRGYNAWQGDEDYTGGYSGTSAAAPVVSGVLALMFSVNDRLTVAQARELLCATAVRVDHDRTEYDELGWSKDYGCGLVDAGAAVLAAKNAAPSTPEVISDAVIPDNDAFLRWNPVVDPDNDHISYEIRVWKLDTPRRGTFYETTQPFLDLAEVAQTGVPMGARVFAIDRFGRGEPSPDVEFTVTVVEDEEPAACGHAPMLAWLSPLMLLAIRRRRS